MMNDAQERWDFRRPFNPTILTGLPRGDRAGSQKRRWVANMLGRDVKVITVMSRDKHRYSGPAHVLVDDRVELRAAWEAAGGTFIHHVSAARSITRLRRIGFVPPEEELAPPRRKRA